MSVNIRVSYERDGELLEITERLRDLPLRISRKAYESGGFKRVYLRSVAALDDKAGSQVNSDK